jgi:hypothetical protein
MKAAALLGLLGLLAFGAPQAGSTAGPQEPVLPAADVAAFAKKVERTLAERGAQVALVARTGLPPAELPPGIRFTHVGLAVYSRVSTPDGRTVPAYAFHNLYQDADRPDRSQIVSDYAFDFFAAARVLQAGVIIPEPALQRRLVEALGADLHRQVHNPRYSVLSNPLDVGSQNCTEWVLDVINAALYRTSDRRQIKANLQAYYEPDTLRMGPLKLLLGSLFAPDVSLADQDGPVRVATFESIADYLQRRGLARERLLIEAEPAPPAPRGRMETAGVMH